MLAKPRNPTLTQVRSVMKEADLRPWAEMNYMKGEI